VVESANQGQFNDFALAGRFDSMRFRAVLFQRPVRTMAMIVSEMLFQNTVQVSSVQHNDVVQAFTPDRTN
jgi:hypothetical protein